MSNAVLGLPNRGALRVVQWVVLIFPLCFAGCFDSHSTTNRANKGQEGIAPMARYFAFGQQASSEKASDSISDSEFQALPTTAFFNVPQLSPEAEELGIAVPSFVGNDRNTPKSPFRAAISKSAGTAQAPQSHIAGIGATAQLFNNSFNKFFSSVFKRNRNEENTQTAKQDAPHAPKEGFSQPLKEDLPNPFTEARQMLDASSASAPSDDKTEEVALAAPKTQNASQESRPEPKPTDSIAAATGSGIPIGDHFLILGDFAGSGTLSAMKAGRISNAAFVSDDGERGFDLYVNTDAVEQSSSFYIDDINGDGITDLLVTSGAALFGGVLLGDSNGGYRVADKFLTGYEPMVPTVGQVHNGMRDILTLDTRTGILTTFVMQDRYRPVQSQQLSFLPSYLLHLVMQDTSRDFVLAAQIGGAQKILAWGDNYLLQPFTDTLGEDSITLSSSLDSNYLQFVQVGNHASIMLTRQGQSFNVANMRVLPKTFLVFGDFYRRGSLDVAVGSLTYFKKK
jgi:hypothetical protein